MSVTHPTYIVTRTDAGADVNYQCPCGCDAGFAFDRSVAEQAPESCCCGRTILVGVSPRAPVLAFLPAPDTCDLDEQAIEMPWGQVLSVVLATPDDAEHGAHAEGQSPLETAHDPVCHMDIAPETAAATANYQGTTYYFCSRGCKVDFEEDTAAVLTAEAQYDHSQPIQHGM